MPTRLVARALASLIAVSVVASPATVVGSASHRSVVRAAAIVARPAVLAARAAVAAPALAEDPAPVPAADITRPVTHPSPEPPAARRVVLYGDSLAWQSQGFFTTALADAESPR